MKHSKWLQLHQQGEKICSVLRQHGYRTTKQHRTLSWKLYSLGQDEYALTWLPDAVSEWTLVPNNTSPERQELWTLIQRILAAIRTQDAVDYSRPWAICRRRQRLRYRAAPAGCPTICSSPICQPTRCRRPQAISQPLYACCRICSHF